jgi:outer membrane biosynthesis protein TonB
MISRTLLCVLVFNVCCSSQSIPKTDVKEEAQCQCAQGDNKTSERDDFIQLSLEEMRAHVNRIVPLPMPALGNQLRLNGVVEIQIRFGSDGKVVCATALSGNSLAIQSAMQVVPKWSFKPVLDPKGKGHGGCGKLRIAYKFSNTESSTSLQ